MVYLDNVQFFSLFTARYCTIVLLLWKKNHFLKCCIFSESPQILVTWVLIFGSSLHCEGKYIAKLYEVYIAGAWQSLRKNRSLNCQLISNSVIQIHSFYHFYGLALIVLVPMVGEADGQDFLLPNTIAFDFILFNYMLLSA